MNPAARPDDARPPPSLPPSGPAPREASPPAHGPAAGAPGDVVPARPSSVASRIADRSRLAERRRLADPPPLAEGGPSATRPRPDAPEARPAGDAPSERPGPTERSRLPAWARSAETLKPRPAPGADPEDPPFEDRLAREGADRLSTEQLVAGILGPRHRAARALSKAARLLEAFETLPRLLAATPRDLASRGRIPPAAAARLAAAFALGRRAAGRPPVRRSAFKTPRDIFERYHPVLREARRERFFCVLLDGKNRVLRDEAVSEGTMTQALVHPREVFGVALRESAAALVLVHNHPSGDPEPSDEDVAITRRLCAVGELVGIRVLDHVVIGDDAFVSFLDRGLLPL